jgi:transcriptional regulator with XRE-family HTH domain
MEVRAQKLQELRRRRVMSISDLSEASGVHRNTIYRIEQGKPAFTSTIRKLAKALEVEPADLVGLEHLEQGET